MPRSTLRIHQFIPSSMANGPGMRAVLWLQGCGLACPGCFNPETHSFHAGELVETDDLVRRIIAASPHIDGVTISGGEPFQQSRSLSRLVSQIRQQTSLSVIVFTGYSLIELEKIKYARDVLKNIDVLIAGRYEQDHRIAHGLMGSTNKELIFLTNRISSEKLSATPVSEVLISPNGDILLTGIDPLSWQTQTNTPKT